MHWFLRTFFGVRVALEPYQVLTRVENFPVECCWKCPLLVPYFTLVLLTVTLALGIFWNEKLPCVVLPKGCALLAYVWPG